LTTVSQPISDVVAETYNLPEVPTVILNAPRLRDFNPNLTPTVRDVLGVEARTPLIAYCGNVKEERGVQDLVNVLELIPTLHAVLVTNNSDPYVERLKQIAVDSGSADRLHLLPYVPGNEVSSFLRTADLGIHTMVPHPN